MTLTLYNTLTRRKEEFKPLKGKKVGLYTCGPTVYNYAHIGNFRAYIFADILKRTLVYNGYKVKQVMNITDVGHLTSDADTGEDKLEKGAKREGKTVWDIAKFYEQAFKDDIKKLNIIEPDVWQRATENVDDKDEPEKSQIELIKKIEKNGFTYETDQVLYFDVTKFNEKYNYTVLSSQKLEEKKVGSRCEVNIDSEKKHPADFVLWLKRVGEYKDHIMHWPSPWGDGFPGWHIECSAISMKHLGDKFDIHTGGIDHIAIHHTNERAQNIVATGHQVVQRWMHNEFLVIGDKDKMAKSGDNFITLQTLIDKNINPLAYRYLCLGTHYRQSLNFSWEALKGAESALNNLHNLIAGYKKPKGSCPKAEERFLAAVNDDLNIPQALAVVWDLVKSDQPASAKKKTLLKFDQVLGLGLAKVKKIEISVEVKNLANQRLKARQAKDWQKSDELRKEIERLGYKIEDTEDNYNIKSA